ncbi:hypothetical protein JCM19301_1954 [Jejuia pallidilutea]|uniref:DUF2891 family protein n=1 Tax=Jejuia pallidilutea TaxID=504487 RepID=A0A090VV10_9FLAO|nr:hypothetical protein JCM19301_1954 [Jejuia pallidilutea]GAL72050.1 hypothetical protein JCM19302_2177 [Jejuia pallidilutea]
MYSCNSSKKETNQVAGSNTTSTINKDISVAAPKLDLEQALKLAELPLHCINIEYPNRLSQTLGSDEDLKSPTTLHPAFYGCFDWHSSVHGHWSLVSLLKSFPNISNAKTIKQRLLNNISKENIEAEVAYFKGKHNGLTSELMVGRGC